MTASTPIASVFETWAHTSIAFSLLIVLVLLVRRPVAQRFGAKVAYLLWALPAGRLFLPALPEKYTALGWLPSFGSASEPVAADTPVLLTQDIALATPSLNGPDNLVLTPVQPPAAPVLETETGGVMSFLSSLTPTQWIMIGTAVWIIGALIYLGRNIYRQWEFARIIDMEASAPSTELADRAIRAAVKVGVKRSISVKTSLLPSGPLVTGFIKPTVLLPAWFEEDYTPAEQDAALLHEMMHIKRGDLWSLQIALLVMALQWFNPLAYFAVGKFRADQEAACDQDVLNRGKSSPRTYGETLVKTVAIANSSRHGALAASLTLNHAIKERLILMQNPTPTLRNRLLGSAMIIGLGACAMAATAQVAANDQELDGQDKDTSVIHVEHDKDSRSFAIHSGHIMAIGDDDDSPALVILGEPFGELENLEPEINKLVNESMAMIFDEDFADLEVLADLEKLSELENLAELGENGTMVRIFQSDLMKDLNLEEFGLDFEDKGDGEITINFDMKDFDMSKFEAKMEAFEVRMEAFEEKIEARAEQVEVMAEQFAEKYEYRFEAVGEAIETLSESCDDYEFYGNQKFVVLSADANDETYRAVCAADGFATLQSDDGKAFVRGSRDLSQAEKDEFLAGIDKVEFHEDGDFDFDFDFDFDNDD